MQGHSGDVVDGSVFHMGGIENCNADDTNDCMCVNTLVMLMMAVGMPILGDDGSIYVATIMATRAMTMVA